MQRNQDAALAFEVSAGQNHPPFVLAIISDGITQSPASGVLANFITATFQKKFQLSPESDINVNLEEGIDEIWESIPNLVDYIYYRTRSNGYMPDRYMDLHALLERDQNYRHVLEEIDALPKDIDHREKIVPMGATMLVAAIVPTSNGSYELHHYSVGDSSLYAFFEEGEEENKHIIMERLTRPDSVCWYDVDNPTKPLVSEITEAQAMQIEQAVLSFAYKTGEILQQYVPIEQIDAVNPQIRKQAIDQARSEILQTLENLGLSEGQAKEYLNNRSILTRVVRGTMLDRNFDYSNVHILHNTFSDTPQRKFVGFGLFSDGALLQSDEIIQGLINEAFLGNFKPAEAVANYLDDISIGIPSRLGDDKTVIFMRRKDSYPQRKKAA